MQNIGQLGPHRGFGEEAWASRTLPGLVPQGQVIGNFPAFSQVVKGRTG